LAGISVRCPDTASGLYRRPADRVCSASACAVLRVSSPSENAHTRPWEAGPSHRFAWCVPVDFRNTGLKDIRAMTTVSTVQHTSLTNTILYGDCIETMQQIPANGVDFIFTDPPYLVNYRNRSGRSIQNDANSDWLKPSSDGQIQRCPYLGRAGT
jgi:hypothetical protein